MGTDLYLGDCLSVLPTIGPVDTVITDPVWPNCPPGLLPGCENPEGLLSAALSLIDAKRVVIVLRGDSDPRFLRAVPDRWPFFRLQNLPYAIPARMGRKLIGDEIAYCFGKPVSSKTGMRVVPGYAPKAQPGKKSSVDHPCSRALTHFRWLVHWWSEPGETVLDPFMGIGTTGIAAVELERGFVGIEIDPRYYATAESRIRSVQLEKNNGSTNPPASD